MVTDTMTHTVLWTYRTMHKMITGGWHGGLHRLVVIFFNAYFHSIEIMNLIAIRLTFVNNPTKILMDDYARDKLSLYHHSDIINLFWPNDAIRHYRSQSILAQVKVCFLMAHNHWSNVYVWLLGPLDIHLRASGDMKIAISKTRLKIAFLESYQYFPRTDVSMINHEAYMKDKFICDYISLW